MTHKLPQPISEFKRKFPFLMLLTKNHSWMSYAIGLFTAYITLMVQPEWSQMRWLIEKYGEWFDSFAFMSLLAWFFIFGIFMYRYYKYIKSGEWKQ